MRDRRIQRMVKRGEITHEEGVRMAKTKAGKEEPIDFHNAERYADPTAYYAVKNIVREQNKLDSKSRLFPAAL